MPHFLVPLLDDPTDAYALRHRGTGGWVATTVETAFDGASRRRGLLGRHHLDPDTAIILAPCSGIHTGFMRFPIDVVFTARDGRVIKVASDVHPWRATFAFRAFAVVELASGAVRRGLLGRGDYLEVVKKHPPGRLD